MSDILTIPTIITHEVANGGALSGVAPNGTDSEETLFRGRYRIWESCTACGLIEFPTSINGGFRVERVSWNIGGATGVNLFVTDPDGTDFLVRSNTGTSSFYEWRNGGTLVPPTFKFKAVSQGGTLTGGRIMFVIGQGWGQTTFEDAVILGRSNLPPGPQ